MEDLIEAVVEFQLQSMAYSYECMVGMVNAWGVRLLKSNTKSLKANVGIPSKIFKMRFGVNPKVGTEFASDGLPEGMGSYTKKIKVLELRVKKESKK